MRLRNTATDWKFPSKLLHWVMVVLLAGLLALGHYVEDLENVAQRLYLIGWHKSFGALVFGLVALRLLWRLYAGAPAPPETTPRWQVNAARLSHVLLYAAIILMPLSGWIFTSASPVQDIFGFRNMFFGLFELPDPWQPGNRAIAGFFSQVHGILGKVLVALIALHVAAALKHHYVDHDLVLRRMWF